MRYFLFITFLLSTNLVYAGAGHDHGESAFAQGGQAADHFDLTKEQILNLGIKSEKVSQIPVSETLDLLSFTELLPEKQVQITPKFESKVQDVFVKVGQKIEQDQPLLMLEPLTIGNPSVVHKSPISGILTSQNVIPGQIVSSGDDMMRVGDLSQILVKGVGYETPQMHQLKVGQPVEVHLDIWPNKHFEGKIQRMDLSIDPKTRTFSVYALIPNPSGNIKPQLQGTMEIYLDEKKLSLTVPKKAVLGEMGSYFVYVIKGVHVEKKVITIGAKNSKHVEVLSGLRKNDRVVTEGNYQLQYVSVSQSHDDHAGHESHDDHDDHDGHDHSSHEGEEHYHDDHEEDSHKGHFHHDSYDDEHDHHNHDHDHSGHNH